MPSRRRGKHTTTAIITLLAPPSWGGNPISQALGALGQALQFGNLSSAQQAYATLQQDLQQ